MENTINVPVWEKVNLTINEAVKYFGIGENTLREVLANDARAC